MASILKPVIYLFIYVLFLGFFPILKLLFGVIVNKLRYLTHPSEDNTHCLSALV